MCAAIDMLSSEQLFYGHSPPAGFLTDYTVRRPNIAKFTTVTRGFSSPCLPTSKTLKPLQLTLKAAPRSCLRMPTENKKKRVVFADDRGYALEQVKFMTEPSHVPPYWALKIVASPTLERKPPPQPPQDVWEIRFVQPASDYLEFRRKINEDCVTLENVILKQNECAVDGTVKVKNLDFAKEVFVRTSSDGWTTSEDTYCAFVEPGPLNQQGVSAYDTFGFRIQLPIHSRRLDFCVGYRCQGKEYWDSNKGQNYTIEKSSVRKTPAVSCARIKYGNSWCARADLNGNTPYW
ncbi:protein phosphatase 1 regulatory subunit 3C [Cydia amplana]|uniref:protein phosphatase 1 regulatory subunit 3C n=1 Tax=Cydia amplana TaxID=1869771 RepID=UPI002FE56FFD